VRSILWSLSFDECLTRSSGVDTVGGGGRRCDVESVVELDMGRATSKPRDLQLLDHTHSHGSIDQVQHRQADEGVCGRVGRVGRG
jgi:hypothetical protein